MAMSVRFVGSGDSFGSGGRFQTCIMVDSPQARFCMDFGTSSLIALAQQGIEHNSIDAIFLSHLHGDHCGGVPFMLMDAMLGAKRTRPLVIAGPKDMKSRMGQMQEILFPGSHVVVTYPADEVIHIQVDARLFIFEIGSDDESYIFTDGQQTFEIPLMDQDFS